MNPVEEDRALHGETVRFDDERGREAMDPTTRHLVLIASGIGVLLAVLIGGWMLSGRHPGSIPVIEAPSGPVRLKPIDPGGMQAMGAASPPAASGKGQTLSSGPEVARPDALQAEVDAARRDGAGPSPPPSSPPAASSPAASPPASPSAPPAESQFEQAPRPAPLPVPHGPARHPASSRPDSMLRTDADPQPAGQPAIATRLAVQLAALGSDAAAQTEWERLRRDHAALFSGHTSEVEQAEHGGHSIYRLRTKGFGSVAEANAFCEHAHAQGVACTLADF